MTCLDPEWVTCFQDQVSNAKDVNELMNNYSLVAVRMWVLHEEAPEGTKEVLIFEFSLKYKFNLQHQLTGSWMVTRADSVSLSSQHTTNQHQKSICLAETTSFGKIYCFERGEGVKHNCFYI